MKRYECVCVCACSVCELSLVWQVFRVKLSYLMMDASMLLPPTDTPLTGIEFTRRLPCGETERARKVRPHPQA